MKSLGGRISEELILSNPGALKFVVPIEDGKSTQAEASEVAVAFNEPFIRELYQRSGFRIIDPIRYGSWCGRETLVGYQDIITAKKTWEAQQKGGEILPGSRS